MPPAYKKNITINKKKFSAIVALLATPFNVAAEESALWAGMEDCRVDGDCSLTDFARLAVNAFDFVLGFVGSLALLVFIYGGILFLFSGGNSDQVEKGKAALKGAAIGLVVVFASYLIVQFAAEAIGLKNDWNIFQVN